MKVEGISHAFFEIEPKDAITELCKEFGMRRGFIDECCTKKVGGVTDIYHILIGPYQTFDYELLYEGENAIEIFNVLKVLSDKYCDFALEKHRVRERKIDIN